VRASTHRINTFFVCKRFLMIVNEFISKCSIWILKIFDLRFNMKDRTSCHIRVFTLFWSLKCAIEINLSNKLLEQVWLRLKSRLRLSIVKYVTSSGTEAGLRQNHVMWLQSRDVTKMINCQDEWIEVDSINLNIYRKDCSS
jgi:hypothetical protein